MNFLALAYLGLVLGALLPSTHNAGNVAFAVRYRNVVSRGPVTMLTVLPGEAMTFEAVAGGAGATGSVARSTAGSLGPLGDGRWTWTAPPTPGLYPIHVVAPDARDSVTLQAFVLVPYSRLHGEYVNGYRIGRYPDHPLRGLAIYEPPAGFIEVTPANQDVLVSRHFRLKQFLCKEAGGYPKYVVLDERLLLKLENLLERVNAAGYRATTFQIMSGYRTPAYNRSLGNVPYSRHTWGAAADIFIDEDGDGRMDDLNGDGRSDIRDAEALYRVVDASGDKGGLGEYPSTAAHGPFVHVDVRDRKARW